MEDVENTCLYVSDFLATAAIACFKLMIAFVIFRRLTREKL